MNASAAAIGQMLLWGAALAVALSIALGLLFNLVERLRRARPMRLDRFGSRLDE